jgi:hypothetical protein
LKICICTPNFKLFKPITWAFWEDFWTHVSKDEVW